MKLKTNDFDPLGGSGAPGKTQALEQPKLDGSMIIPSRLHEGCILKYEDMAARYGDQREENRRLVDKIAGLDYQDRMKALKVIELQEELQFSRNAEALQAAKLAKMATELEATKAKLEDAEIEVARLSDVALDGYHALEKERENSARIKRDLRGC